MTEEMIFKQAGFARKAALKLLQETTEAEADIIPHGYRNNIRWHLGHIFTVQEMLVFFLAKEPGELPEGFKEWFGNGTSPANWPAEPPTLATLAELLEKQTTRIQETFKGRLDEVVPQPFNLGIIQFETIGEILNFSLYHEAEHVGLAKGIKKFISK